MQRECLPRLCQACQASKDDDAKNTGSTSEEPVCDALGRRVGEAARLGFGVGGSFRKSCSLRVGGLSQSCSTP